MVWTPRPAFARLSETPKVAHAPVLWRHRPAFDHLQEHDALGPEQPSAAQEAPSGHPAARVARALEPHSASYAAPGRALEPHSVAHEAPHVSGPCDVPQEVAAPVGPADGLKPPLRSEMSSVSTSSSRRGGTALAGPHRQQGGTDAGAFETSGYQRCAASFTDWARRPVGGAHRNLSSGTSSGKPCAHTRPRASALSHRSCTPAQPTGRVSTAATRAVAVASEPAERASTHAGTVRERTPFDRTCCIYPWPPHPAPLASRLLPWSQQSDFCKTHTYPCKGRGGKSLTEGARRCLRVDIGRNPLWVHRRA